MYRVLRQSAGGSAASLGSFVLKHSNAGFRVGAADYAPGNDTHPVTAEQERQQAFDTGYAEGRKTVEAEFAAERDALIRLAEALDVLRPEPANALAMLLAETVDRLVRETVGEVEVDANLLLVRANAAAKLVARDVEPSCLRAHPDDIIYLEGGTLDVALQADPGLARGTIILETGHGWIEDGPAVRLDRLRGELDKMVAAR